MTDAAPACRPTSSRRDGTRSVQTSTTNIGAYMWSAVAAERLGHHLAQRELVARLSQTLTTLERMERYEDTGQFYNWYDHRTGAKLDGLAAATRRPSFHPILSSVDNGWLAVGLQVVAEQRARRSRAARGALYDAMDFGFYYRPERQPGAVPLPPRRPRGLAVLLRHARQREPDRRLPRHRARPAAAAGRTTGAGAPSPTPATTPSRRPGRSATGARYLGVDVFEGAYRVRRHAARARPGAARCSRR